mgnify:FL=1
MIQDMPQHPDDNPDMKTSFNEWLDYMEENFPDIDAIKFYETKEIEYKEDTSGEDEALEEWETKDKAMWDGFKQDNLMGEDWEPDYSATAKYEGPGKDEVKVDTSGKIDPLLLGMVGPNGKAKAAKGMLSGAGKVIKKAITPKVAKTTKDAADKAMQKQGAKAAATVATALGLAGNRNKEGDFVEAASDTQDMMEEDWEMNQEPIDLNKIARGDDSVGTEEPEGGDKEERPGWHKTEGANWWSVNQDSNYWQTAEGAEEAKSIYGEYPSWVKQPEKEEVNWAKLFG